MNQRLNHIVKEIIKKGVRYGMLSGMLILVSNVMISQDILAEADAHINSATEVNYGGSDVLVVGIAPLDVEKRIFMKFDVSDMKADQVENATLRVYLNKRAGLVATNIGIHEVVNNWTEGSGLTTEGNVTDGINWTTQPRLSAVPFVVINPGLQVEKWIEIEITPLVKKWINGAPNYGIALTPEDTDTVMSLTEYSFFSREYAEVNKRPTLIVRSTANGTQAYRGFSTDDN